MYLVKFTVAESGLVFSWKHKNCFPIETLWSRVIFSGENVNNVWDVVLLTHQCCIPTWRYILKPNIKMSIANSNSRQIFSPVSSKTKQFHQSLAELKLNGLQIAIGLAYFVKKEKFNFCYLDDSSSLKSPLCLKV